MSLLLPPMSVANNINLDIAQQAIKAISIGMKTMRLFFIRINIGISKKTWACFYAEKNEVGEIY